MNSFRFRASVRHITSQVHYRAALSRIHSDGPRASFVSLETRVIQELRDDRPLLYTLRAHSRVCQHRSPRSATRRSRSGSSGTMASWWCTRSSCNERDAGLAGAHHFLPGGFALLDELLLVRVVVIAVGVVEPARSGAAPRQPAAARRGSGSGVAAAAAEARQQRGRAAAAARRG